MLLSLPTRVQITRKKFFVLNLNHYRNTHFTQLNNAKIAFKSAVQKAVCALPKLSGKVHLTYILYPKTKQKCDVANVCSIADKFFSDALVEFGIIPEDNYDYLPQVVYQFGSIDKMNPRVDVLIETWPDYLTRITQPQIKEQDPMQITLNEAEIKRAIAEFVTNRMEVDLNQDVAIDLKATRGQEGFTAQFDVIPRQRHTEAKLSGVVDAPLVETSAEPVSEKSNTTSTVATPKPASPKPVAKAVIPTPAAEVVTPPAAAEEPAAATTKAFAGQSSGEKPKSLFAAKAAAQEAAPEETVETEEAPAISSGEERVDPSEAADTPTPSEPSTTEETEQPEPEAEQPAPTPAKKPVFSFAKKS